MPETQGAEGSTRRPRHSPLLDCAATTLILLAPFVAFVHYSAYPFARPEILAPAALLFAAGGVLGAALYGLGPLARSSLLAGLLALSLEPRFPYFPLLSLPLLFSAAFAVCHLLRTHAPAILATGYLAWIVGILLAPATDLTALPEPVPAGTRNAKLAPIVHIVLDEHIGIEGIPREIPGAEDLVRELKTDYVERGFRLFGGAYSQYEHTQESLANLFNFTSRDVDGAYYGHIHEPFELRENAYLRALAERGYALRVYQTSFIDLCSTRRAPVESCVTSPGNDIKSIETSTLDASSRAWLVLRNYAETFPRMRATQIAWDEARLQAPAGLQRWLPIWGRGLQGLGPLLVPRVIERIAEDIRSAPQGAVFLAHLLIPHSPYVFDAQCVLRSDIADWRNAWSDDFDIPIDNDAASWAERYPYYFEQVRCQQQMLGEIFAALRDAGVWDTATVIIHGDHGSRIAMRPPHATLFATLVPRDFVDAFSTLFAVKAPGLRPGYEAKPQPLQNLLAVASGREAKLEPGTVYLQHAPLGKLFRSALPPLDVRQGQLGAGRQAQPSDIEPGS